MDDILQRLCQTNRSWVKFNLVCRLRNQYRGCLTWMLRNLLREVLIKYYVFLAIPKTSKAALLPLGRVSAVPSSMDFRLVVSQWSLLVTFSRIIRSQHLTTLRYSAVPIGLQLLPWTVSVSDQYWKIIYSPNRAYSQGLIAAV